MYFFDPAATTLKLDFDGGHLSRQQRRRHAETLLLRLSLVQVDGVSIGGWAGSNIKKIKLEARMIADSFSSIAKKDAHAS